MNSYKIANLVLVLFFMMVVGAMPAAVNTVVFSENYNGDSILASKIVFLTTMLSILTIPLILIILHT